MQLTKRGQHWHHFTSLSLHGDNTALGSFLATKLELPLIQDSCLILNILTETGMMDEVCIVSDGGCLAGLANQWNPGRIWDNCTKKFKVKALKITKF